jgi:hypothetical protein
MNGLSARMAKNRDAKGKNCDSEIVSRLLSTRQPVKKSEGVTLEFKHPKGKIKVGKQTMSVKGTTLVETL